MTVLICSLRRLVLSIFRATLNEAMNGYTIIGGSHSRKKVQGITPILDEVEVLLKDDDKVEFPNMEESDEVEIKEEGDCFIHLLRDFLDQGIFNSDAHLWQIQRKTTTYEFSTRSLRNFILNAVAFELRTRLLPILAAAAESGGVLDLQDVLERFAFDNVCKVAFNVDPACLVGDDTADSEFMRAFEDVAALSSGRFMSVFPLVWKAKKLLNVGTERRLRESISTVHQFANAIVRSILKSVTR
ncbi:hypothetical protein Fmac_021476 [Flemingia macrophylla]|uniref:Uncharacterized protein n=1 Tax=Flemingia macrophylla TaxID=520843 RepID=A0ABD1LX01_9FABA